MEYNAEKKTITIFGKSEKLDTLCNKLAGLNGEQVYSMFSNRGILVPRKLNCYALYSVINEKLKKIHASEMTKDAFTKLKFYKDYSEYQLTNLFNNLCDTAEDFKQYRVNLMKLLLINHVGLNLNDGEINYLKTIRKQSMENFSRYQQFIVAMEQEQVGTFDGVKMDVLKSHLATSASAADIIALGDKYGITIPEKLRRDEVAQFICDYLKAEDKLTPAMSNKIKDMNITELNALCKVSRIQISSSMTKADLIFYLFYTIGLYKIPTTSMKKIEVPEEYKPLDFTVDMTVFKGFKADDTRRIIIYPGCENDEFEVLGAPDAPLLAPKATNLIAPEKQLGANAPEDTVDDTEQDVDSLMANLVNEFTTEEEEEAIIEETATVVEAPKKEEIPYDDSEDYVFDDEEEIIEEAPAEVVTQSEAPKEETPSSPAIEEEEKNDFFDSLINEATKKEEVVQENPLEEQKILRPTLPMDDVRDNVLFGDEKIMNYAKGNKKKALTALGVIFVTVLLIGAGVAYLMLI